MQVNLPYQYGQQNNLVDQLCSSPDESTLFQQVCTLQSDNGQLKLKVLLKQILIKTSFSFKVQLNNPSQENNLYMFSADFYKDGQKYATSLKTQALSDIYVGIVSDSSIIETLPSQNNVEISVQNIPFNSGEPATYIFKVKYQTYQNITILIQSFNKLKIPQPSLNKDALLTEIFFPKTFSSNLGDNLECSIFQSNQINLIFDYQSVLQMRTNQTITNTEIPKLYKVGCRVDNDHILSIQGISEYLKDSSIKFNYIIIRNIMNPGDDTDKKFKIVHSSEGYMLWIFDDSLDFKILDNPDSLDLISIESSSKTINDQSTYTFKLYQRTPSNILSNYGLLAEIPDQYKHTIQTQSLTCSLSSDDNQQSPCWLYKEFIFILDKQNKINILAQGFKVKYLQNPQVEDPCKIETLEIKNKFFKFKVIDLTRNIVISTSRFNDSKQCLQFSRDKFNIKIQGETNLVKGLSYAYQIIIEKPANCLSLEPYTDDKSIKFYPRLIKFEEFEVQTTKTFEVIKLFNFQIQVKYSAKSGTHFIRFKKEEYTRMSQTQIHVNSEEIYSSTPTLQIKVNVLDERKQARPYIIIDDFLEYGRVNSEFMAFGRLTKSTSEEFIFEISYNEHLSIQVKPLSIKITQSTQQFNFTIKYLEQKIIEPIKLNFILTPSNSQKKDFVYGINSQFKWLVFTISSIHKPQNVLKMYLQNNIPSPSLYKIDVGKTLYDPSIVNEEELSNPQKVLVPEILQTIQLELSDYHSLIRVIVSFSCKIYYVLTLKNSEIPEPQIIKEGIYQYSQQFIHSQVMTNRNIDKNIDYSAEIKLLQLLPDYSYSLFLVCENAFGLSKIVFDHKFQTLRAPNGVSITFSLKNQIQSSILINSLSLALRIPNNRIKILTDQEILQKQIERQGKFITYEIVISPNTKVEQQMINYVADYIKDATLFNYMMSKSIPEFINTNENQVKYRPFNIQGPTFTQNPVLKNVSYYHAAIDVEMWENSYVYAQVVERTYNLYNQDFNPLQNDKNLTIESSKVYAPQELITQQIIMGIDQRNYEINPNWFIKIQTDALTKKATLFIDDLKDGTAYDVYISATNIMPYNDESLFNKLSDQYVIKISFTTLFNYNVDPCQMLKDLYKVNPQLAQILKRRMDQEQSASYCYQIFDN